jgi:hypothetical protein
MPNAALEHPQSAAFDRRHVVESPFPVADQAQLFIDSLLIAETRNIVSTLHAGEKHAANPLVSPDRPWEGWRVQMGGDVLFDEEEGIFKMWYMADGDGHFRPACPTLYATSRDGLQWEKPLVGTIACRGHEAHNAVATVHSASIIKDLREANPARRYKMTAIIKGHEFRGQLFGYRTLVSPDGLHWEYYGYNPIAPGSDVITGFHFNERLDCYVAIVRRLTPLRGFERRVFYLITSPDFLNWSEPRLIFSADKRDDVGTLQRLEKVRGLLSAEDDPSVMRTEIYGVGIYQAESCTVGFPWIFSINNRAPASLHGNQEGPCDIQLAVSRDLENWERPFRTPVVPLGAPEEWDSGFLITQSNALRVGDEIRLYYSGWNFTHGAPCCYVREGTGRGTRYRSQIGLVTWKLDRFVSLDGPPDGGEVTTVPLTFTGNHLELNARVAEGGMLRVELLDPAGQPLPGWALSDPWTGDRIRGRVSWAGNEDVSRLARHPLRLRFHLRAAELFSFAFRA